MPTTNATHTPGPWAWDGKFTVSVPHAKGETSFRTNPEDARLIAVAPELYELLKDLSQWGIFKREFPDYFKEKALAAIAKAEGA